MLHERFEDDAVVIDTVTGRLTVLSGLGADVWARFVSGARVGELLAEVEDRYGRDAAGEIADFVGRLRTEHYLRPIVDQPSATAARPWPDAYSAPGLEVFDDIADIMTMDPIHEVDVSEGWPHTT